MRRPDGAPPALRGFTYLRRLGSGGFSDVYLYEQELPRRQVAVKVLLTEGELAAGEREAFVGEANLMARLSTHPYIVTIYHADVSDDGRPYFIMEYYGGPSLADSYKARPMPVAEVLRTGIRVAAAIATAHADGILHRDIKPANVLTNEYGWPGLTDFGISSAFEEELPLHTTTRATLTETGGTTGSQSIGLSVPWSPPEMFDDDPKPDVRADVFSLAATLYTLLAGRTPFEVSGGPNQALDLMARIERGAITPMTRTDVPSSLLAVLRKGMAVDKAQRFASAVDFARALQRVELELSYAMTPIEVPNLTVAPERPVEGDADDETRARVITSISAQPVTPPRIQPPEIGAPSAAEADRTQARRATVIVAATAPVAPPAQSSSLGESTVIRSAPVVVTEPAEGRRRRPAALVPVIVGLLLAVAIVVGLVLFLPRGKTSTTTSQIAGGNAIDLGTAIPSPVAGTVVVSPDGTSVTFTWTNPSPVDGDSYLWSRSDGSFASSEQATPTSQATAVVTGVKPGTRVCISVSVLRSGNVSATPLSECTP